MKGIYIPVVLCLGLALAGCEALGGATDVAAGFVAEKGNDYCDARDQELRDDMVARINDRLRSEGAKWTFEGITCDPEAPAE